MHHFELPKDMPPEIRACGGLVVLIDKGRHVPWGRIREILLEKYPDEEAFHHARIQHPPSYKLCEATEVMRKVQTEIRETFGEYADLGFLTGPSSADRLMLEERHWWIEGTSAPPPHAEAARA